LWVRHPIEIKARVTPELKKAMAAEIQDSIKRLDIEVGQLEFQMRRGAVEAERREPQASQLRREIESEKQKRINRKNEMILQLKEIGRLEDGTEIKRGAAEGLSQVEPGAEWESLLSAEVLIEDGKVVEVRRGSR